MELPEYLRQGISEWLNASHGTGAGLEVSAVLLRPPPTADTVRGMVSPQENNKLLLLPPEMRNRIYGFALIEAVYIIIGPQGPLPAEPALLRTCSQIRKEASGIYYRANYFKFDIMNNDASVYIQWCRRSPQHRRACVDHECYFTTNWPNLMIWLKAYHDGECSRPLAYRDGDNAGLVNSLCKITSLLFLDIDWADVEKVLGEIRQTLATYDYGWLDDQSP